MQIFSHVTTYGLRRIPGIANLYFCGIVVFKAFNSFHSQLLLPESADRKCTKHDVILVGDDVPSKELPLEGVQQWSDKAKVTQKEMIVPSLTYDGTQDERQSVGYKFGHACSYQGVFWFV